MSEDDNGGEIISEYFRIKHVLMDFDQNLREAIGNARIRMNDRNISSGRLREHFLKAQKHVGMILDLGISAGAIPLNADKEKIKQITAISQGQWKGIEDFEMAQQFFRECYQTTKFYNVIISRDNRPAVVKKYGGGRFST